MNMITVLGASGFIGSHLVNYLDAHKISYLAPERDADLTQHNLGDVIYCIGLTADFRSRPFDTVEAHVCKLSTILKQCNFASLTYLSSTRVYGSQQHREATVSQSVSVDSSNPSDLYNLSKLMGESIGLQSGKNVRVVRVSNVYGDDWQSNNFLTSIIRDAVDKQDIQLHTSLESSKDYISIEDVVVGLYQIAVHGQKQIYNLAAGKNISNRQLVNEIARHTNCTVNVIANAPTISFPQIRIAEIIEEFEFQPISLLDRLDTLIQSYRSYQK